MAVSSSLVINNSTFASFGVKSFAMEFLGVFLELKELKELKTIALLWISTQRQRLSWRVICL
jgi:hypothetical protein